MHLHNAPLQNIWNYCNKKKKIKSSFLTNYKWIIVCSKDEINTFIEYKYLEILLFSIFLLGKIQFVIFIFTSCLCLSKHKLIISSASNSAMWYQFSHVYSLFLTAMALYYFQSKQVKHKNIYIYTVLQKLGSCNRSLLFGTVLCSHTFVICIHIHCSFRVIPVWFVIPDEKSVTALWP